MEAEPAVTEGLAESVDKLTAKDATEDFDRKKEGVACVDPACAIGRQPPSGNHTMHMRVKFEFLIPSV